MHALIAGRDHVNKPRAVLSGSRDDSDSLLLSSPEIAFLSLSLALCLLRRDVVRLESLSWALFPPRAGRLRTLRSSRNANRAEAALARSRSYKLCPGRDIRAKLTFASAGWGSASIRVKSADSEDPASTGPASSSALLPLAGGESRSRGRILNRQKTLSLCILARWMLMRLIGPHRGRDKVKCYKNRDEERIAKESIVASDNCCNHAVTARRLQVTTLQYPATCY